MSKRVVIVRKATEIVTPWKPANPCPSCGSVMDVHYWRDGTRNCECLRCGCIWRKEEVPDG